MILSAILCALAVVTLLQLFRPGATRFLAASIFVVPTLLFDLFLSDLPTLWYYPTAALFDLAIIVLLSGINPVPKMVLKLQAVSFISILLNLAGFAIWGLKQPPTAYDSAFIALYLGALLIIFKGDRAADVGSDTVGSRDLGFSFGRIAWVNRFTRDEGEV